MYTSHSIATKHSKMNMSNKAEVLLYQPLQHQDSFRLLKLQRSPSGDSWDGTLVEHRLTLGSCEANAPKYLALSYVWGKPTYNVPSEDSIGTSFSMSTALAQILGDAVMPDAHVDRSILRQSARRGRKITPSEHHVAHLCWG